MGNELQPQPTQAIVPVNGRPSAGASRPEQGVYYGSDPGGGEDGGGLLEYWRILRRRKGTLVLVAFLGALAGVLVSLPQTPVYQARASIEIQDLNDSFLNLKQVNPVSDSGGNMSAITDIQTQIKVLQSETLTERVLDKLKITKPNDLSADTSRVASWRKALNLPEEDVKSAREQAMGMAAKNLKVRAAGQTRIIEILCDSTDPKMAAAFANTLASEYIEQNIESRWKMTERTGVWLTRQIDDMRVKLERSEDALQKYARDSGLMFTSDKSSVAEEKLLQLQESLSKAQSDRVEKQSRFEIASKAAPETLADVLNDTSLREYQVKLTDLRRQRSDLITVYTADQTKVKRVDAEIGALEAALQKEQQAIVRRIQNDYDEALNREKLLAADYGTQIKLVTDQSERSIQYNILKREVESNRQLYDAMLQKMKESSVASALRASNVRVVDGAKPPTMPYKPNTKINAALGLFSGLFLGASLVVMRHRANRALQEPGDASFYLNLPELGVIPSGDQERRNPLGYLSRKALPEKREAANGNGSGRLEMVTWHRKPSVIAESFRAVLTSILFSGSKANQQRLLLTSAGPQEGKTTVICNLGIAMAEVNKRVLLIDADMRRPRLHDVFQVPNERGLSDLLQTKNEVRAELKGLVVETAVPGLFVLPCGPATSAAANLLHSGVLAEALAILDKEFDLILIDTPPMLQMPDARVVGRVVDGVILVVRAGHTTRDAALAARQRLHDDKTPVTGVILNDWNPKMSANGYYGYYNGYYYKSYQHYAGNGEG